MKVVSVIVVAISAMLRLTSDASTCEASMTLIRSTAAAVKTIKLSFVQRAFVTPFRMEQYDEVEENEQSYHRYSHFDKLLISCVSSRFLLPFVNTLFGLLI